MSIEAEMNRGFLQILVLVALEESLYGYRMLKNFEATGYTVEENTLYPLLRRLEQAGLINSKWSISRDRPRKFYHITPKGRKVREKLLTIRRTQDMALEKVLEAQENG
jgi:DNA-binding PadR family transcriptional regulator